MGLSEEAERASHGDIGVRHTAEPELPTRGFSFSLQEVERRCDLRRATVRPDGVAVLPPEDSLVEQAHRLVREARGQGADAERGAAERSALREEPPIVTGQLVEGVENGGALDECLFVIHHEDGHPQERVVLRNLRCLCPNRPRPMFVRHAVVVEGNGDASNEWRVELANEEHGDSDSPAGRRGQPVLPGAIPRCSSCEGLRGNEGGDHAMATETRDPSPRFGRELGLRAW